MFNAAIKVIFKEAFQNLNRSMRPLEIYIIHHSSQFLQFPSYEVELTYQIKKNRILHFQELQSLTFPPKLTHDFLSKLNI